MQCTVQRHRNEEEFAQVSAASRACGNLAAPSPKKNIDCGVRWDLLLALLQDTSRCCMARLRSTCTSALLLQIADLDAEYLQAFPQPIVKTTTSERKVSEKKQQHPGFAT